MMNVKIKRAFCKWFLNHRFSINPEWLNTIPVNDDIPFMICEICGDKWKSFGELARSYAGDYDGIALDNEEISKHKEVEEKDDLWTSYDGSKRSVRAFDNEHLANVILHLQSYSYNARFLLELQKEAAHRGLTEKFLMGAPYPFKDKVTNEWLIWSFEKGHLEKISGAK